MSFFLWRFFLSLFLRLWVAILCRFLFLPHGIFLRSYIFIPLDTRSQFLRRFEGGGAATGNLYLGPRTRIPTCPRCPGNGSKRTKTSDLDVLALLHGCNYRLDKSIDHYGGVGLGQACSLSNLPYYVSLGQSALPINKVNACKTSEFQSLRICDGNCLVKSSTGPIWMVASFILPPNARRRPLQA